MLEAKDQGHNEQVFSDKKKVFTQIIANFSSNFRRKRKGNDLGPFFTNQKIVLFLAVDRAFSRTYRQGWQHRTFRIYLLRTSHLEPYHTRVRYFSSIFEAYRNYVPYVVFFLRTVPSRNLVKQRSIDDICDLC